MLSRSCPKRIQLAFRDDNIQLFYTAHRQSDLLYPEKLANWQKRPTFRLFQQVGRFQDAEVVRQLPKDWQVNTIFLFGGPSKMTPALIR